MVEPARNRPRRRRLSVGAAVLVGAGAALALGWLLVQDLYLARPQSVQALEFEAQSREYQGELSLSGVAFDHDRLTLTATVSGRIRRPADRGVAPERAPIWIGIGADLTRLDCTSWWGEEEFTTPRLDKMEFNCGSVSLPAEAETDEVFYPFDEYTVALRPRLCVDVNSNTGCTPEARNVDLRRVELRVSDRTLQISPDVNAAAGPDGLHIGVRRKRFLRTVTATFGGFACAFLWVLARLAKPEELVKGSLGYFGTFWGLKSLIVPSTVRAFPTVVDYVIFSLFSLLFLLLLIRWWLIEKEAVHG